MYITISDAVKGKPFRLSEPLTPGSKINFKEVNLEEAEDLFKSYNNETNKYLNEYN